MDAVEIPYYIVTLVITDVLYQNTLKEVSDFFPRQSKKPSLSKPTRF